jgi:lipopolysaccharide export system protein LptA
MRLSVRSLSQAPQTTRHGTASLVALTAAIFLAAAVAANFLLTSTARAQDSGSPAVTAAMPESAATSASDSPASPSIAAPKKATDKNAPDSPFTAFANSKNRGPVNIQSESLTLDYKSNSVLFQGNVHATQADGQLSSNALNVKYGKDFHEIQEMVAEGNVRLSQGLRWCAGDHGVMNQAAHTVILTGNPICHDNKDQISGDKIVVHLDTGKSEVEGGVKAVIFPREAKSRDNEVPADNTN